MVKDRDAADDNSEVEDVQEVQSEEGEEHSEEEYEIEAILDAKHGAFPGVRLIHASICVFRSTNLACSRILRARLVTWSNGRATTRPATAGSVRRTQGAFFFRTMT